MEAALERIQAAGPARRPAASVQGAGGGGASVASDIESDLLVSPKSLPINQEEQFNRIPAILTGGGAYQPGKGGVTDPLSCM